MSFNITGQVRGRSNSQNWGSSIMNLETSAGHFPPYQSELVKIYHMSAKRVPESSRDQLGNGQGQVTHFMSFANWRS